ncbi:MAG TPA: hypothetical protein VHB02_03770 [Acidimicrobiales bacterium]|nr:hypothetical protein [Acidimicrobiales bacterium]
MLDSLDESQRQLLEITYLPFGRGGNWPVWDYVDRTMRKQMGLDPLQVLSSLPTAVGTLAGVSSYRLLWNESGGPFANRTDRVGLTVAGLSHLAPQRAHTHRPAEYASLLVRIIADLANRDDAATPDPDRVTSVQVPLEDLLGEQPHGRFSTGDGSKLVLFSLQREPPLWGSVRPARGKTDVFHPDQRLAPFVGVADVEDYLQRLITYLGADLDGQLQVEPAILSPLDFVEALGYLDAVWQSRFRKERLLGITRPGAMGKLVLPCASSDEFDSRMSAMADVLNQLTISLPPAEEAASKAANEKSLGRLRRRLHLELPTSVHGRINQQVKVLRTAVRIRVGGQHTGAERELSASFAFLGIPYPLIDLTSGWQLLRSRAANALDVIRQELEALPN